MHGIVSSISRPGWPCDNANCESFFRTLKREEDSHERFTRIWKSFDLIFQRSSNVTTTERDYIQRLGIGRLGNSRRQPTLPMQQASRLSRNSNLHIEGTFTFAARCRHKFVILIVMNGGKMRTKGEQRRRK